MRSYLTPWFNIGYSSSGQKTLTIYLNAVDTSMQTKINHFYMHMQQGSLSPFRGFGDYGSNLTIKILEKKFGANHIGVMRI